MDRCRHAGCGCVHVDRAMMRYETGAPSLIKHGALFCAAYARIHQSDAHGVIELIVLEALVGPVALAPARREALR